jgi:hypothetical protein
MYFPIFLCKFSRGEEVFKAGGGVRCTTSNGTCSYIHTLPSSQNLESSIAFPTFICFPSHANATAITTCQARYIFPVTHCPS